MGTNISDEYTASIFRVSSPERRKYCSMIIANSSFEKVANFEDSGPKLGKKMVSLRCLGHVE
jgi:hypothetical protein